MVCNTQNYWDFGPYPSSGILEIIKHKVSENGFVSVLMWGEKDIYSVRSIRITGWMLALSKRPKRIGIFHPHLRTETHPVSETLCFLVIRTP
jgi:hypothetical protein